MRRFLKKLRKGLKTACLAAALATCWNVGQVAKADYGWDELNLKVTGTILPTENNVSNLYLLYGLNNSYVHAFYVTNLGNFPAGVTSDFTIYMTVPYDEDLFDSDDRKMYWEAVGLYGDISGGVYDEGVNGVTLGVDGAAGDSWSSHCWWGDEWEVFNAILNYGQDFLLWSYYFSPWYYDDFQNQYTNLSIDLFDFSTASYNGQIQFEVEVVPEPVSIFLFGTGGLIVIAMRRRKYLNQ
jgi:hypothetical protein